MIIICPSCEKKFELDENLIPDKGRLLKCGSCDQTWFYNKNVESSVKPPTEENILKTEIKKKDLEIEDIKNNEIYKSNRNLPDNKRTQLIKYKSNSNFTIGKFLSYILVSLITFVALIVILDTFKNPLSVFFPNLELILYNLFETLRDLTLFAKDLR
tara:strand:- start:51 stop:521 length:471 start_codon:yes stop_codon:yes gene_type:complete